MKHYRAASGFIIVFTIISALRCFAAPLPITQLQSEIRLLKNQVALMEKQGSYSVGGNNAFNPQISVDALFAGGGANGDNQEIKTLEGGAHDPHKKGFTLQNLELSISAAVDPYLNAQAHIVFQINEKGESTMEVEELFFTTAELPLSLELKGGQFFTEFGRINPTHPHTWGFVDQPVVNTRMFGGDGLRNTGFRLSWLTPFPWYSELFFGFQNANGETAVSFLGTEGEEFAGRTLIATEINDPGDLLYSGRWLNSFDISETTVINLGFSALTGPNGTGKNTQIYGSDLYLKWKPLMTNRGWPFATWQTEVVSRNYETGSFNNGTTLLPAANINDWGGYTQVLWGFTPGWVAGLRYDAAEGEGGDIDPLRDFRRRSSVDLTWFPSEFSKLRLQYNHDEAKHAKVPVDSVWFQFEFMMGAHGAHTF